MVVVKPVGNAAPAAQPPSSFRGIHHIHWINAFRKATPREQRQALITSTDLLAGLPTIPKTRECYMLCVYLGAAQYLEGILPNLPAEPMAAAFDVPVEIVTRKLKQMMSRLLRDDRGWAARTGNVARAEQRQQGAPTAV